MLKCALNSSRAHCGCEERCSRQRHLGTTQQQRVRQFRHWKWIDHFVEEEAAVDVTLLMMPSGRWSQQRYANPNLVPRSRAHKEIESS